MWGLLRPAGACLLALAHVARLSAAMKLGLDISDALERTDDATAVANSGKGCAALENRGTHFTIDVFVGTPGQQFAVVVDTGSNSLIVPSCVCKKNRCLEHDRCFTGTNKSSTFKLEQSGEEGAESMVLTFGSGQIQGVVAKDVVRIGEGDESVESFMSDGLLLMIDRALNIQGTFEGILGLGVPLQPLNATATSTEQHGPEGNIPPALQDVIDKILGARNTALPKGHDGVLLDSQAVAEAAAANTAPDEGTGAATGLPPATANAVPGRLFNDGTSRPVHTQVKRRRHPRAPPRAVLEQANIDRFSVCFNTGAGGVLRLGTDAPPTAHSGVGKDHWGVDFRGISVGESASLPSDALFCQPGHMTSGQETPCGAIPDSGTTVLMGPESQVTSLLEAICENWERCRQNVTALEKGIAAATGELTKAYGFNPFNMSTISRADVLQVLLLDCESWLGDGGSLDEMPPLHFHVAGGGGTQQSLKLPAHLYVLESTADTVQGLKFLSGGRIPMDTAAPPRDKAGRVCAPAFGVMDYNTKLNGPIWILGTPLFYQFVVGYDVSTKPPSMSFTPQEDTPCGRCRNAEQAAMPKVNLASVRRGSTPMPIHIWGPVRLPSIDVTKPL